MKDVDLRSCLESWPYDAETNFRIGRGTDGREIILVRLPMGLEQYEVEGRPDGARVQGRETLLDAYRGRMEAALETGYERVCELKCEDCAELFHEANAFYDRLSVFIRLEDWTRAERDAVHILRILDLVKQHAACEEDRGQMEAWRPQAARIRAVARAMMLLDKQQYGVAWKIAREEMELPAAVEDCAPDYRRLMEALLDNARKALAHRPAFHPRKEALFLRQDDYWTIRYQGHSAFLKCTRGLQCLCHLLRAPRREFHVSELLASLMETPRADASKMRAREGSGEFVTAGLYESAPILDSKAKREYLRRLSELRHEAGEAERFNDSERAEKAQEEMNAITQHLASAMGLGGRDRRSSSEAERARCAITKRIKKAIQKVGGAIPSLGHHLAARIKTGYFCSYRPHPDYPVAWKF